jgi:hypothetical protein
MPGYAYSPRWLSRVAAALLTTYQPHRPEKQAGRDAEQESAHRVDGVRPEVECQGQISRPEVEENHEQQTDANHRLRAVPSISKDHILSLHSSLISQQIPTQYRQLDRHKGSTNN